MPTESAPPAPPPSNPFPPLPGSIKCSLCGAGAFASTATRSNDGVVVLNESIERICGGCVRAQDAVEVEERERGRELQPVEEAGYPDEEEGVTGGKSGHDGTGLGLLGMGSEQRMRVDRMHVDPLDTDVPPPFACPLDIPQLRGLSIVEPSRSLPAQHTRPWSTKPSQAPQIPPPSVTAERQAGTPPPPLVAREEAARPANHLLDVTRARVPSTGRAALYPGSVFKGTQTSGRSAYEVEVRILDVNFPASTLSGYLSISHLTDAHPHLTTFFTSEIIGPTHGFVTGARFGATEHDDMRHWGRFEQFRRPSTRADMLLPDLLFRDPLPDRTRGETKAKERDFVFLRMKERFLVPDHKVRDISGASFAGFYYAMVDFAPSSHPDTPPTPTSPVAAKSPMAPTSPSIPRRQSSSAGGANQGAEPRSPSRPRMRRDSSARQSEVKDVSREATIRGYYFHSLNQEPFQELFLTHVPTRSSSTFEFR